MYSKFLHLPAQFENCRSNYKKLQICKIWGSQSGGYEEYYLLGYNAV
jgi:hypothetical protein